MIFHFTVFLFSALFFGMLSFLLRDPIIPSWTWYGLTTFVFTTLSMAASRQLTGKWYPAFLPSVVSFSALLLLSLIDIEFEQNAFVWVATLLFYSSLLGIYRLKIIPEDETARALLNTAALASLFFTYAAAYGLYLNYTVPISLLMFVFFLATAIVAFQTLFWAGRDDVRSVFLSAVALGTVIGELIWIVHFWPFGYLTVGAVMLVFFYGLWRYALDLLRHTATLRRTIFESAILLILIAILVATSPWRMRA